MIFHGRNGTLMCSIGRSRTIRICSEKSSVRHSIEEVSKSLKYQTGPHTLSDGRVSRGESAKIHDVMRGV